MSQINRRKLFNYKGQKNRVSKTTRTEMQATERAFAVGAITAGKASHNSIAKLLHRDQSGISKLVKRVTERAEASELDLWDSVLYENDLGRGRSEILTQAQKDEVVRITIQDRAHRQQDPRDAVRAGNFDSISSDVRISVSTFKNIMYGAGYSRQTPGMKPPLTDAQKEARYKWALAHNPDKDEVGDNKGFNFRRVVFTDEATARVGEQYGMKRAWAQPDKIYHEDVKRAKIRPTCTLQFYGAFTYDSKGPCHIYSKETKAQKQAAKKALEKENKENEAQRKKLVPISRAVLREIREPEANSRKWPFTKKHLIVRGNRSRGGVDRYRHREEVLKPLIKPWLKELKTLGRKPILLEDRAPAHASKIATEFLEVSKIEKILWVSNSPDLNAAEHAWPWIRRHITKDFGPSTCEKSCRFQWQYEWEELPIDVIND